uniref:Microfibril associated protein 4 n=1 Tax=Hucho hucho TaxID=62062 RepID=A0A4W5M2R5_9TELE
MIIIYLSPSLSPFPYLCPYFPLPTLFPRCPSLPSLSFSPLSLLSQSLSLPSALSLCPLSLSRSLSLSQVFQRRMDGTENFYRHWAHYKSGFGNVAGEYWLGLDNIFLLTMRKKSELRVDMEDFEGGKVYAKYTSFSIDPENYGYTLRLGSYVDGGAGDSMSFSNGMKFSTYDNDQDTWSDSCARRRLGAFWFGGCADTNPNSLYAPPTASSFTYVAVYWFHWKGLYYSLKSISFKIRAASDAVAVQEQE